MIDNWGWPPMPLTRLAVNERPQQRWHSSSVMAAGEGVALSGAYAGVSPL
jgi:hypothetical protein